MDEDRVKILRPYILQCSRNKPSKSILIKYIPGISLQNFLTASSCARRFYLQGGFSYYQERMKAGLEFFILFGHPRGVFRAPLKPLGAILLWLSLRVFRRSSDWPPWCREEIVSQKIVSDYCKIIHISKKKLLKKFGRDVITLIKQICFFPI